MGAGVSDWKLARAVSQTGQLGVVSGVALEIINGRRLQAGDPGGHVARALRAFPDRQAAETIIRNHLREPGSRPGKDSLARPHRLDDPEDLVRETIAAAFVEVFLAKEGHDRPVGINLLTKIQLPIPATLYGAMLAGVDFVIMGAGIPRDIPGILDDLARHRDVSLAVQVKDAGPQDDYRVKLSPRRLIQGPERDLSRPAFLPIVSSNLLAATMARKANGSIEGLVVEGHCAGGHNAPPRGALILDEKREPVYGPKDEIDLERIAELGLPFYLAGGYGYPGKLEEAEKLGASGIQVGTLFAFCRESGLLNSIKETALVKAMRNIGQVITDVLASPTGFPFKVLNLEGTLSDLKEYLTRPRVCDFGFLRSLYKKDDGQVGYRCPAESENSWLAKGGEKEELEGRKCLCNGLLANIGHAVERGGGYLEKPLLTVGAYFDQLVQLVRDLGKDFSAAEVIDYLLGERNDSGSSCT